MSKFSRLVILFLTEGRGGRFENSPAGLRYSPSGAEPASIVAFSRSGMFPFARPYDGKAADPARSEHRGIFFTYEAVERLRSSAGRPVSISGRICRQLDFENHILPIVVLEMAVLYYRVLFGDEFADLLVESARPDYELFLERGGGDQLAQGAATDRLLLAGVEHSASAAATAVDAVLTGGNASLIDDQLLAAIVARYLQVIFGPDRGRQLCGWLSQPDRLAAEIAASESPFRHPLRATENLFSWGRMIRPVTPAPDYQKALLDFMDRDHRWAAQNNLWNPAKAAIDGVWRDLKGVFARVVNFGGLTAASHRRFLDVYLPYHNRLVDGAPLEVMEKIKALMEHGLLDLSVGPGAEVHLDEKTRECHIRGPISAVSRRVDTVIDCRVPAFDADCEVAPLYPNLLRKGFVRKWRNPEHDGEGFAPGGLDLTDRFHPITAEETVDTRLTFFGPPSEGMKLFQSSVLRPDKNHHMTQRILVWLSEFWPSVAQPDRGGRVGSTLPAPALSQADSRSRRLIRPSIADIPRSRSGLISAASPSSA